jgi:zinc transporter ZupT
MKRFIELWIGFAIGLAIFQVVTERRSISDFLWAVLAGAVFAIAVTLYLRSGDKGHAAD